MKLLVGTDAHIFKTPDGAYWCTAIYSYDFWKRYMEVFKEIRVAARVKNVSEYSEKWKRVDGDNVEVYEIPFYQGPIQLIKNYIKIQKSLKRVYEGCDAAIYRLPSPTAQIIWNKRKKIPTALEVVYDLSDDIKANTMGMIASILARIQAKQLKSACLKANGVSYVTKNAIQKNFPSRANIIGESKLYFEEYYSTITLNDNSFGKPRVFSKNNKFTLVLSDVAMNSDRKGEKTLFTVIKALRDEGLQVYGTVIGDGSKRLEYENLVKLMGIDKYVEFTGLLSSSDEVRKYLKKSDIFVFPTAAEGLPRGVLEAMAIGLPVVTSPVGGIPEVISKEYLAHHSDVESYVRIVKKLITNPCLMEQVSRDNIIIAQQFRNTILQKRRNEFYRKLAELCKEK